MSNKLNCKFSNLEQICKFYKIIEINKEKYYVLKNKNNNKLFLLFENNYIDKIILENEIKICLNKINEKIDNNCNLIDYSTIFKEDDFSSNYKLRYFYEITNFNIYNISKINVRYLSNFLIKLCKHGIKYINNSYDKDKIHNDLRPCYIFYNKWYNKNNIYIENYEIKFWEYISIYKKEFDNIQLDNILNKEKDLYWSFDILDKLKKKQNIKPEDIKSNNLFVLGLIVLELGLKVKIQDIYNRKEFKIYKFKLNDYIKKFNNEFSNNSKLINFLEDLLNTSLVLIKNKKSINNEDISNIFYKPITPGGTKIKYEISKTNKSCEINENNSIKEKIKSSYFKFNINMIDNKNKSSKNWNFINYKFNKAPLNLSKSKESIRFNNSIVSYNLDRK